MLLFYHRKIGCELNIIYMQESHTYANCRCFEWEFNEYNLGLCQEPWKLKFAPYIHANSINFVIFLWHKHHFFHRFSEFWRQSTRNRQNERCWAWEYIRKKKVLLNMPKAVDAKWNAKRFGRRMAHHKIIIV